jgi:PIN domain nuclease of toxin-antitoxin system
VILLDTHALIWLAEDNPKLGPRAARLADSALARGELLVAAVSFWEIAMLAAKRRLVLAAPPAAIRRRSLEQGIRELALNGTVAIEAAELAGFHGDPADRMIVATALSVGATLLTADDTILGWSGQLRTHDARH